MVERQQEWKRWSWREQRRQKIDNGEVIGWKRGEYGSHVSKERWEDVGGKHPHTTRVLAFHQLDMSATSRGVRLLDQTEFEAHCQLMGSRWEKRQHASAWRHSSQARES